MKICIMALSLVLFTGLSCLGQDYLLHRKAFKAVPSALAFSPDGKLLLTGFMDGSFHLSDPKSLTPSLEVKGAHDKPIVAMDMPPKMDFIMTAGGKMIKAWDREGKQKGNFSAHATTIWNVDISPDGRYAVSSAFNRTFLLWDVYEGVVAAHMRGHRDIVLSVCISPDKRSIASGGKDPEIRIWDLETRELRYELHGPTQDVLKLLFSPDGKRLAAASLDKSIRMAHPFTAPPNKGFCAAGPWIPNFLYAGITKQVFGKNWKVIPSSGSGREVKQKKSTKNACIPAP